METFRCPTCIAVLTDANARRCPTCNHRLRRRSAPQVLGDKYRLDNKLLPIDHWMRARIDAPPAVTTGGPARRRRRQPDPMPWAARFQGAPAPDLTNVTAPAWQSGPAVASSAPETPSAPADPPAIIDLTHEESMAPATVTLADDALAAYLPPPVTTSNDPAGAVAADPVQRAATELEPEIQALVDDLYRRARAELKDEAKVTTLSDEATFTYGSDEAEATVDPSAAAESSRRAGGWHPAFLADRPSERDEPSGISDSAD